MKNFSRINSIIPKKIVIILLLLICLPLLSFKDNGEYRVIDGNVISRGPGNKYLVGVVNVMFKNQPDKVKTNNFGIESLDNLIKSYDVEKIIQRHPLKSNIKARKIGDDDLAKIYAVKYNSSIDPFDFSEILMNKFPGTFQWAEPSFVYDCDFVPNDPIINGQWHLSKINAFQAWDICQGDTNVIVGIVDSGTDFDHPDLSANIKLRYQDPVNSIDDDMNGYVDDFYGWDFYYNDNNPSIMPGGNVHGSHVAGCVSQVTNNGIHGGGIGFKVKLLTSKHTDDTNPESSLYNTDNGIAYCYQNGAKVINCSFGNSTYSAYSQTIVNNAWANGTIICASAGNGDASGIGQNWARYPASYDHVISTAATSSNDVKATFSNYHSTVDVCSPGEGILSTLYNNTYATYDGTSMASPITAGTVALIISKYPGWTPQQVVDRLKLGVDSIYNLNPTYVGMLGTGRVNAFKCLSDYPILKLLSCSHNDSLYGNNDKVYDVDEVIPIQVSLKNTFIQGSNVSIRLTTTDPDVELVQDSVYVGDVPAFGTFGTNMNYTFRVKAKSSCSIDKSVTFKLSNSSNCYTDNSANTFTIKFRQGFATHNINNLKLALTSDGAIGKKAQSYGTGLYFGNGNTNNIFESGLMIGISNTQVSDVCRKGTTPANASDTDFVPLQNYALYTPGTVSSQDGNGRFNDNGAGASKIGVEVTQKSYAFNGVNDSNYILFRYTIKNTNSNTLNNLFGGIFTVFSPSGSISNSITRYDAQNNLGYTYSPDNTGLYIGVALMTGQTINFKAIPLTDIINGFTTAEKWQTLSSGVFNDSIGPGSNAFTIAVGPLSIASNQTESFGFALIRGYSLEDLKNKAVIAKAKYNANVSVNPISDIIPNKFELLQNYPNPFNPETKIKFAIPENTLVKINIYDVLGREIQTLVNEKLTAGIYEYSFNGSSLPSGAYFYRITTDKYINVKRMLLIK
jgi:serine protease